MSLTDDDLNRIKNIFKEEVKTAVKEEVQHLATKGDVHDSESRLRDEIKTTEDRLRHEIKQSEARLSEQIHDVGVEVVETRAAVLQREHPHAWRAAA